VLSVVVKDLIRFRVAYLFELKIMRDNWCLRNLRGFAKDTATTRHNNNNKQRMDVRELFTTFLLKFLSLIISTLICSVSSN
jgi:hypothetical protein